MTDFGSRLRKSEWEVREIAVAEARLIVEEHHYSRRGSNTACYTHGLFKRGDDRLWGCVWWLPPTRVACESVNKEQWKRVLGLTRMVCIPNAPKNACSFMLGASERIIRKEGRFVSLVTYADESQGHSGGVYRSANWTYIGRTGPYPRWIDPTTGRQVAVKATTSRTKEQMLELGYEMQGKFFKHKFVKHLFAAKPGASPALVMHESVRALFHAFLRRIRRAESTTA